MDKNPEKDIYKALRRNTTVVWGLVLAFIVSMIIMCVLMFRVYSYNMNHTLTLDKNGDVLPLTWIERDESIKIEMKHHIEMFLGYFYNYDRNNWKSQLDKALWLGDESIEKLFLNRESEGWFNEVNQLGISQQIVFSTDSIKIYGNKEPFEFSVWATLILKYGPEKKYYHFTPSGYILLVNRNYPYNPHGLLITKYAERNKTEFVPSYEER